jgi:hypothetical protein
LHHLPSKEEVSDTSSPQNLLNYTRKLYHNNLKVTIENKGKGTTKETTAYADFKNNHKQN